MHIAKLFQRGGLILTDLKHFGGYTVKLRGAHRPVRVPSLLFLKGKTHGRIAVSRLSGGKIDEVNLHGGFSFYTQESGLPHFFLTYDQIITNRDDRGMILWKNERVVA